MIGTAASDGIPISVASKIAAAIAIVHPTTTRATLSGLPFIARS
jgi:hypothetical protein